jgi:hypothetical protein
MDLAEKQLAKVAYLTPFARNHVLQHSLGSHVIPIDDATREVILWLGLAPHGANSELTADEVKAAVRKQDAQVFCHLLRELVTDRRYAGTFSRAAANADTDGATAVERLKQHLAHPPKITKKSVKKSHKRPPVASRTAKRTRTAASGTVRKRVTKPKSSGGQRRVGR